MSVFITLPPSHEFNKISVLSDIVVFALIVVQTRLMRSLYRGVGVPSILDTINRDAGLYFAVIASSHFIVVILYSMGRVRYFAQTLELDAC